MKVDLTYGTGQLTVDIPSGTKVDFYEPGRSSNPVESHGFLVQARKEGLSDFLAEDTPLIIVNDANRNTPTARLLGWLKVGYPDLLEKAGFLVACGTHAPPTEPQLQKIFGEHLETVRPRVAFHDARNQDSMTMIGEDRYGGSVYVDTLLHKARRTLVLTSSEPHYFAGFTGGRKSILPGLSDIATIERNHNMANSLAAAPLKLKGNPVAEHMGEVAQMAGAHGIFSVQVVLDAAGEIAGAFFGPLDDAFAKAVDAAEGLYAKSVTEPYDVVLCEVRSPFDRSLYQVQKALENSQTAVADGGADILVSACSEGIGPDRFFKLADEWDREKNEHQEGKTVFGSHKLSRVNGISRRIEVLLHSGLPDETVRKVFYEPMADVDKFLKQKANGRPGLRRMAVVHDASNTVLTMATNK
ncbi:MAG: DUF2088 domain-containing protein [Candidatus Zixiibacteriota bacterium]|nr:MAG: DUF2088 domain-containing protein [candidate division Zixibacteria bacterium]